MAIAQPGERRMGGRTSVISRGGCYFRTAEALRPGAVLRLTIESNGTRFESWARVAHVVPGAGMGLAFLRTDDSQNKILDQWLLALASA
jgi:hypothetical protein